MKNNITDFLLKQDYKKQTKHCNHPKIHTKEKYRQNLGLKTKTEKKKWRITTKIMRGLRTATSIHQKDKQVKQNHC